MPLAEILKRIEEEMLKRDKARQEIQAVMRRITRLSKRAIFSIHKDNLYEARKILEKTEAIFTKISDLSASFPDLLYMGSVDSAFQEYAEAQILLCLVDERRFPDLEETNVPPAPYVLGLADVIGEFRRRALNSLKSGDIANAEECLDVMETTFEELINLDDIQILISGLRRKCDVGRRIIEATRGDITIEARRSLLENTIKELKQTLEVGKSDDSS